MKRPAKVQPAWLLVVFLVASHATVLAQQAPRSVVADFKDKYCGTDQLPTKLCDQIIQTAKSLTQSGKSSAEVKDEVAKLAKSYLLTADNLNSMFLNSPSAKKLLGRFPLELEFTQLETDNSDAVLGLSYGFDYQVKKSTLNAGENAKLHYAISFNSSGTITKNAEENPHNFIDSKLTIAGKRLSNLPVLSAADVAEFRRLNNAENMDNPIAITQSNNMLMGAFTNPWFIEYGVDLGIESDQAFKAQYKKISAFSYIEYEDMSKQSLLGDLGLVPSIRVALASIQPNSDTPRALAGDSSAFTRASFEAGVWLPLGFKNLAFTFNYRTYQELGAAEVVKAAGLAKAHLRTYTITGPLGLFASYSSGSLPFSLQAEETVQLGWKWHFSAD